MQQAYLLWRFNKNCYRAINFIGFIIIVIIHRIIRNWNINGENPKARFFFFFNNQLSFYFLKEKTNMLNLSSIYNYNLLSFLTYISYQVSRFYYFSVHSETIWCFSQQLLVPRYAFRSSLVCFLLNLCLPGFYFSIYSMN